MRFESLYRISFYSMLVLASLVMSVDAPDSKIAMYFPVGVAIAGFLAFITVDRDSRLGLTKNVADLLSLGSIALLFIEYTLDEKQLLLALGHWLVYLQLVLIFRRKTIEGDWWLYVLGLVEVLVGGVISQSDAVGIILFLWAITALWVFGLFSLQREATRARTEFGGKGTAGLRRGEMYPGLFTFQFVLAAARLTTITLALGGVIFLAMPRTGIASKSQGNPANAQHLTGFNDEVQLGQLGEILENDDVVMSIELFDEANNRLDSPERLPGGDTGVLWRGVTMQTYEKGRWTRQPRRQATFPIIPPSSMRELDPNRPRGFIKQVIKLEPNDSSALFALRPMLNATLTRRNGPDLNGLDGSIYYNDVHSGTLDYEVSSYRDPELPQPGENFLSAYRRNLLQGVPESIQGQLQEIATKVLDRLPADRRDDRRAQARALEAYLRDSGEFGYSLMLDSVDRNLDPVVDFLVNRKQGHCEYFASGLTLLLRSVGIPARLVNGFKGGDWNDLAKLMIVRQKHAHSWVEAYLGEARGADRSPIWLTLDPTPGNERARSVARVGGFASRFRQATDFIRYVWVFYIVGYSAERQYSLLYGPAKHLVSDARRGFGMMSDAAEQSWARLLKLLTFPSVQSFISVRGFFVSFILLLLMVGLIRFVVALSKWIYRLYRGSRHESSAIAAGATHYRRLVALLAKLGLERPPTETQEEFARRAGLYLNGRGANGEVVADVPRMVVEAFYRARFGHLEVQPDRLQAIEERLDALEASLNLAGT